MDPRDFQTLAVSLVNGGPAGARSAVSRCYYAAFNVAAAHLRSMGFRVSRGAAAHGEVRLCLMNSGDAELQAVATRLNDLHHARNRADYQLDRNDIERVADVRNFVSIAGAQIHVMDVAFSSRGAQLQAAIAKWRKENGYP